MSRSNQLLGIDTIQGIKVKYGRTHVQPPQPVALPATTPLVITWTSKEEVLRNAVASLCRIGMIR